MKISVEKLVFTFPDDWMIVKYDDTAFYRKQFIRMWNSIKAVDLIAVSPDNTAYFIEVKDYRLGKGQPPSDLPLAIARKIFDTLAAQLPWKLNVNDSFEQSIARRVCECTSLVIVLHLETKKPVGLFHPYDPALLLQKLRQLVKPIHAHPKMVNKAMMQNLNWTVQ